MHGIGKCILNKSSIERFSQHCIFVYQSRRQYSPKFKRQSWLVSFKEISAMSVNGSLNKMGDFTSRGQDAAFNI